MPPMSDFFAMGGYAVFVWSAYGLGAVVVFWNALSARALHRAALADARRRLSSAAP
jgi:heme exporter protein D